MFPAIQADVLVVLAPLDWSDRFLHVDQESTCDAKVKRLKFARFSFKLTGRGGKAGLLRAGKIGQLFRKDLLTLLTDEPRSVSWLARELGLKRGEIEDDLEHALRSARAAGHQIRVVPARCRSCGFTFSEERLSKPGRCPACRGTRLFEPQISLR